MALLDAEKATEDECKDCYPELGYKNNKLKRDTEAVKRFVESDFFKKLMKSLNETREFCETAVKVLEKEPCEDSISRKEAVDCLTATKLKKFDFILHAREEIKKLPPVTPQPKMGKWIKSRDSYGNNHFTCPFCENDIATKYDGAWEDNYCSNCGAKMQEVEE